MYFMGAHESQKPLLTVLILTCYFKCMPICHSTSVCIFKSQKRKSDLTCQDK